MSLYQPLFILLTVLLILLSIGITWLIVWKRKPKSKAYVGVANTRKLLELTSYKRKIRNIWLASLAAILIAVLSLSTFVFATSRPITLNVSNPDKYNRDIVLCLDVSASMLPTDIQVLQKFKSLAEGFKGERIGLNIFNATSRQMFPLTDDYDYIQEQLDKTISLLENPYQTEESTVFLNSVLGSSQGASLVGDGLYGCTLSFDNMNDTNRARSIILATDNVVNGTELVTLDQATEDATEKKIRVYGLNPGNTGDFFVPDSAIEEMRQTSERTQGKLFDLADGSSTSVIIDEISQLDTTSIKGSAVLLKQDHPQPFLYIGGIALLLFLILALRRKI